MSGINVELVKNDDNAQNSVSEVSVVFVAQKTRNSSEKETNVILSINLSVLLA